MTKLDELRAYIEQNPNNFGRYIAKSKPELFELIKDQPGETNTEKAYNTLNPGERAKHLVCGVCGAPTASFVSFRIGYRLYCSNKCSTNNPATKAALTAGFHSAASDAKRKATIEAKQAARALASPASSTPVNPKPSATVPLDVTRSGQRELVEFLASLATCQTGVLIKDGFAVDVLIPSANLAVDFVDPVCCSESAGQDRRYRITKTKLCEEHGIKLLSVFEDEWLIKSELIKARLRVQLGQATRVYARKCKLVEVSNKEAMALANSSHIQGGLNANIRLGLMHEGKLVALMTFCKPRFNKHYDWELLRYCSAPGMVVVGGAGKLLKHFRSMQEGSIISYADRRWSNGNLYTKLGFTLQSESVAGYFYIKPDEMVRVGRVQAQKHRLHELLGEQFDETKSELENMTAAGYERMFDCGTLVFGLQA